MSPFVCKVKTASSATAGIDTGTEPEQLSLGGLEGADCVALGMECVNPLDDVPDGKVFEEEAGQPVSPSGWSCFQIGVPRGSGSCLYVTYIHALIRANSKL